jgi:hypothetical protein
MAVSTLGYVIIRLTLPVAFLRTWQLRALANEWAALYGSEAITRLREQIAGCQGRRERRRLYRLHDEIARRDPNWAEAGPVREAPAE